MGETGKANRQREFCFFSTLTIFVLVSCRVTLVPRAVHVLEAVLLDQLNCFTVSRTTRIVGRYTYWSWVNLKQSARYDNIGIISLAFVYIDFFSEFALNCLKTMKMRGHLGMQALEILHNTFEQFEVLNLQPQAKLQRSCVQQNYYLLYHM